MALDDLRGRIEAAEPRRIEAGLAKLDTKIERALDLVIELGDLPEAKARLKELERLSPPQHAPPLEPLFDGSLGISVLSASARRHPATSKLSYWFVYTRGLGEVQPASQ